jgi:CheY-like chemotaxis protein
MTPRETFHQAKVEHYTRKASDFVRMGRYPAARKAVESVLALDPGNADAAAMRSQIETTIAGFTERHRGNGHNGNGHNGNGHNGNGHNGNGQKGDEQNGSGQNGNGRNGARHQHQALILCVDQDERVLTSLSNILRRHGYQWIGAASYDEATDVLSDIVPDVVISEVNFEAGPRGFDLFLWLRSNPSMKKIPFLFHATRIDQEILIAGKRFGVDDFIVKPADGEVVAAAVTQILQRRKQAETPG